MTIVVMGGPPGNAKGSKGWCHQAPRSDSSRPRHSTSPSKADPLKTGDVVYLLDEHRTGDNLNASRGFAADGWQKIRNLNVADVQNAVPVLLELRIVNGTAEDLREVDLWSTQHPPS